MRRKSEVDGRKTPDDVQNRMVDLYLSGRSMEEAARVCGFTSGKACMNALRARNVTSRKRLVTVAETAEIARRYAAGESKPALARAFGLSYAGIGLALVRAGQRTRTTREAKRLQALPLREDFFSVIDTEEKAYWLGFLAADGCNTGRAVALGLQRRDRAHVELFKATLGSGHKITDYVSKKTGKPYSRIAACSTKMCEDLARHGIVRRKTWHLEPWEGPEELLRHYWRGYVDGDGWVISLKRGGFIVGLLARKPVTEAFIAFVQSRTGVEMKTRPHAVSEGFWDARTSGIRGPKGAARLLYEGATVYLARKYEKAVEIMAREPLSADTSSITLEELQRLFALLGRWKYVAEELNVSGGCLRVLLRRFGVLPERGRLRRELSAERLLALRVEHGSWRAVARFLGVRYPRLWHLRRRLGLPVDDYEGSGWRRNLIKVTRDEFLSLVREHGSMAAASRALGKKSNWLWEVANSRGWL